jgi:hypothetical protein
MFMNQKKLVFAKIEGTPYSGETLTNAQGAYRCSDLKYTPAIAEYARKYATGDLAKYPSVMGKQTMEMDFSMDLAWGGAAQTAPEWDVFMTSCACTKALVSTTGIKWELGSVNLAKPLTIWIAENNEDDTKQMLIKMTGAVGDCKLSMGKIGDPIKATFKFQGVFNDCTDTSGASMLRHGTFLSTTPDAVLSSTITALSYAADFEKVDINFGNKLEPITDPSNAAGIKGYIVTDRDPKITCDPYLATIADKDYLTKWKAGTTGTFSMTVGAAGRLTLSAPAAQILKAYEGGARNNMTTNSLELKLTRTNDSTDAEFKILQGA